MTDILEETLPLALRSDSHNSKWDKRFLEVARLISTWSKDPSTKVGAIAVDTNRRILAQGYNGFPKGIIDDPSIEREIKYMLTIHAEANVVYNACRSKTSLEKSTIYVYGMYPCPECVKGFGQIGVARLVFQVGYSKNANEWAKRFNDSRELLRSLGIGFTHYREELRI